MLALGALERQRDSEAKAMGLELALQRSRLERLAADARLAVLTAQVEPHFLFNTLANVQALVETGSPRAPAVLRSLIAYLKATMPRLDDGDAQLGREIALVRSYLELMHLRMPDRLHFTVDGDAGAAGLPVSADAAADAGGERGAPRHRPVRDRRQHRGDRAPRRRRWCAWSCATTAWAWASRPCPAPAWPTCASAWPRSTAAPRGWSSPSSSPHGLLAEILIDVPRRATVGRRRRRTAATTRRRAPRMTARRRVRALIADDEPLLRTHLAHHLAQLWPELQIAGEARNGREAVDLVVQLQPDVVFLDVHMPGMNGVEAARLMGPDVQIVFVTAYEQYAVAAFEQGAIDYLVKPFDAERLGESVARLRRRVAERRRMGAAARAGWGRSPAWRRRRAPRPAPRALGRPAARPISTPCCPRSPASCAGARRRATGCSGSARRWADDQADPGRRGAVLPLRREVHAGRVGRRRGADPQVHPRAAGRPRARDLHPDPPLHHRQPALRGPGASRAPTRRPRCI